MTSSQDYRNAMANLAGAVTIITAAGPAGRVGCTVSAVCSVTDSPPTLLLCISRASRSHAGLREAGSLCVNVPSAAQRRVAQAFADGALSAEERFAVASWDHLSSAAPALREALASFDCEITATADLGTHTVFTCAVQAVRTAGADAADSTADGLVYFQRAYQAVRATATAPATA